MRLTLPVTAKRCLGALPLLALCAGLVPRVFAQRRGFERATVMLRELDEARLRAAASGKTATFTMAHIKTRLAAIEKTVNGELSETLWGPLHPGCRTLQEQLRRALGYRGEPDPHVASVICSRRTARPFYVIAYALAGAVAHSRSWVGVFGPSRQGSGAYALLAGVDNSLPNKTVALAPLLASSGGTLQFLAYGVNWGDALNRLTVVAYRLTGSTLALIWSRENLPEGKITVEHGTIRLRFLNAALGPGHKGVHWLEETYEATATGIVLRRRTRAPRR